MLTGMETDLRLVRKVGKAAIAISVAGIVVPFACGFALGQFLPASLLPHPEMRLVASLFLGTALSISSVKIVAVVVREMNFMRRNVGQIIVATAVIDDTIGWIIIAIIFSLASRGTLDVWSVAQAILGTLAFLAVSFTIGRRLVFRLIRWANDNLVSSAAVISVILLLMSGMALVTHLIGVHTVLGAFVAGVLVGQSPILTRQIDERLRGLIAALFMPVFFGLAGLSADLTLLGDPNLLLLTVALVLVASIGKFGGAFVGGALGGLTRKESFALASGMNARGSTEVIIATIGLSMGVLDVTTRAREKQAGEAVVDEARKGFDLLVVGMDKVIGAKTGFDEKIGDVTAGFEGPLAIVVAKSGHLEPPLTNDFRILVPVSGSGVSRRGAELAVALARTSLAPLRLVYVSTTRDKGVRRDSTRMSLVDKEAILKDAAALAARYEVNVTTSVRANAAPEEAILHEIRACRADMVVMGVDRIHGDTLSFGGVADAVLRRSKVSVLLVSTGEAGR
jgi:Kef-type K+ transport system membrane component KefB